jgi:Delta7-sterol 5-desaturase
VHHQSVNPTPMAALSFHPLEAVLEFAFVPVVVFLLPVHPAVLPLLSLWSMVWNIVGHLGYELFPASFTRHWLGQWFNTATHHNLHHQRVKGNYGLYFNVWDRLMHTNHPDYFTTFDAIKARQQLAKS